MHDKPIIFLHLITALAALLLGIAILARRKGTFGHRTLGWSWVVLMAAAAASSVFIRDYRIPNIAGYTPIHLLTLTVAVLLPLAIGYIRRGNVAGHRRMMTGLYIGGCIVAGLFALAPARFLGRAAASLFV
ncbi:MAG: DUF2306 domain-containing protein [Burkholderiaceae bacterium]|nr:DUF2306 domain-containing protein [Burkholderiaceae bacterium]